MLDKPDGEWMRAGRLPYPVGYGVSVSTETGIVCVGGSDSKSHHREVFRLEWREGYIVHSSLLALPLPCALMAGARVDQFLYISGGQETPDSIEALRVFWRLNLQKPENGWEELPPCPGPQRILAVAGSDGKAIYLFGGAHLKPGPEGPQREYLGDAWRYSPKSGWSQMTSSPLPIAAAP